ncbi:MAG: dynamin family protein [Gammaproteobacteria bacterium]|nr:dynamin family protein [Gammaproteobacteria bacterium]
MTEISHRLDQLEAHLKDENPILLDTVRSYRQLDTLARKLHLFDDEQSYATQVTWFPLISILGTFSAGKSTFINDFVGVPLQKSGNQAVDDKFTVICYGPSETPKTLPGIALDADMRFPLYGISDEIESVSSGEGRRIDAYLQLKTVRSEPIRGRILIDSPGFDADSQRTSTLRITDQIIAVSDLVLVFFDARHPEPGAMADTLEHLVSKTLERPDASKFLYVLNQLDTASREDNPEEVVAAWQRALASCGLTAGRFYTIYSKSAGQSIENESLRARFERKRDADYQEIMGRINDVQTDRVYRIISQLEHEAHAITERHVPKLMSLIAQWKKRVMIIDAIGVGLGAAFVGYQLLQGVSMGSPDVVGATALILLLLWHFLARKVASNMTLKKIPQAANGVIDYRAAFLRNTRAWRSIWFKSPAGWGRKTKRGLRDVITNAGDFVRSLNDSFTDPTGRQ